MPYTVRFIPKDQLVAPRAGILSPYLRGTCELSGMFLPPRNIMSVISVQGNDSRTLTAI
jgi:hypothetical protein